MKKILLGLLMAFVLGSTVGFAQTTTNGKKACYVDANNNKVCDKYENHTCKGGNGTGALDCKKSKVTTATTTATTTTVKATPQNSTKKSDK